MCRPHRIPVNAVGRTARLSVPATFVACVYLREPQQAQANLPHFQVDPIINDSTGNNLGLTLSVILPVMIDCLPANTLMLHDALKQLIANQYEASICKGRPLCRALS